MTTIAPAFPTDLAERWGIETFEPIADTHTSHVYRVHRPDGSSAVAKLLKPTGLHELPGFDFLGWRGGEGAVRLLDRAGNTCLLEDAGSLMLSEYFLQSGDAAASAIIVEVVRRLHCPSSATMPSQLVPLRRHFRALFEQAAKPHPSDLFTPLRYCAAMADTLIEAQTDIRPLHGDLHHENIISGAGRGWLAIDPQGLIGDPAYEVANIFGNPRGLFPVITDPGRILRLAKLFAPVIGSSEDKILRYAIAHAGLSLSWSIEDGEPLTQRSNAHERLCFINVATGLLEAGQLRL